MKGLIIAGTQSGCGKTTVTIGLMKLLKSKGLRVAPFKTGPDYIDPMFHEFVTETPSYNLDSFMLGENMVKHLFTKHSQSADISVVEGVMGLFDGIGPESKSSTAELSKILDLPVILVLNCTAIYQSVAAIVAGFKAYMPELNIAGVILNRLSGKEHYQFLKDIIEQKTGVACLGYLPSNKSFALESRHLGLMQAEEVGDLTERIDLLGETMAETIDIQKLLDIAEMQPCNSQPEIDPALAFPYKQDLKGLHLGIAYDKAFRFYYRDNLELLEECGATLHYFSPINDAQLPAKVQALYLGGGYPEVFASQLSANCAMLEEIKTKANEGMPVFAECGGLMYLTSAIVSDNEEHKMAGIFNCKVQMTKRLQRFGYAEIEFQGTETRCHEFHHSHIVSSEETPNYQLQYKLQKPEKNKAWECGLQRGNVLGGYAHIHFYSDPHFFKQIAELWKKGK